ncbi:MAG TPA: hypothetical protein VET69_14895 [Terriglobales bacterium]|nr:hypothetical protein [Terriglobales bacterium]
MKTTTLTIGAFMILSSAAMQATASELNDHIYWAVAHEGCRAWKGTSLTPSDEFKVCAEAVEQGNPAAVAIIKAENDQEIQSAISEAVRTIPTDLQLQVHFAYVMDHFAQRGPFHTLKAQGNFEQIRYLYTVYEANDRRLVNILASISDTTLANLIP